MPPRKTKASVSQRIESKETTEIGVQTTEDFLQIVEYEEKIHLLEEEIKTLKTKNANNLFEIPPNRIGLRFTTIRKSEKSNSPISATKNKGCNCKGNCSTRICGCVKKNKGCFEFCKCNNAMCRNQEPEKENIGVQHPALTINDEDALDKLANLTLDAEKSAQKNRSIFSPLDPMCSTNSVQGSPNFLEKSKKKLFTQNNDLSDIDTEETEDLDVEIHAKSITEDKILQSPAARQSRIPRSALSENEKTHRLAAVDAGTIQEQSETENVSNETSRVTVRNRKPRRGRREENVVSDNVETEKSLQNPGKSRLPRQKGRSKNSITEKEDTSKKSVVHSPKTSPVHQNSTVDTDISIDTSPKKDGKDLLNDQNVSKKSRKIVANGIRNISEEVSKRTSDRETKKGHSPKIKQSRSNKKVSYGESSSSSQDESKYEMLQNPEATLKKKSPSREGKRNEEKDFPENELNVPSTRMTRSRSRSSSAESLKNFKPSTKVIHSPQTNTWINPKQHAESLQVALESLEQVEFENKFDKERNMSATSNNSNLVDNELKSGSELNTTSNTDDSMERSIHPMMPKRQLPRSPVIVAQASVQPESKRFSPPKKELDVEHIDWEQHKMELVPCPKCHRKFFPHRIEKHKVSCKKI